MKIPVGFRMRDAILVSFSHMGWSAMPRTADADALLDSRRYYYIHVSARTAAREYGPMSARDDSRATVDAR